MNYRWWKGATQLNDGATGTSSTISGATSATLTISNTSALYNSSAYNVKVMNVCSPGGLQSNNVALTTKTLPTPTAPNSLSICAGEDAVFNASATGTPPFTYQWRKGTSLLVDGPTGTGSIISGATTNKLTISNVSAADAAANYNYVTNNGCTISAFSVSASLTVNTAPSIGAQPVAFSGCSGYTASFSVGATSNLSLTYKWFKGTTALVNGSTGTGSVISGATEATLLIANPSAADNAANYHVEITNSCTTVTSNEVSLSIGSSLPTTFADGSLSASVGNNIVYGTGCGLITTVTPSGSSPVSGNITGKVWVESGVPNFASAFYLGRHYEITPDNEGTATLKLYFLQSEFDAYNHQTGHGPDLPIDANDVANNKNNIRIAKKSGISSDGSGQFDTYSGASFTTITPSSVVWEAAPGYWTATLDVTDFSGFFLTTNPVALPVSLVSFKAEAQENKTVDITWSTASETNNKSFIVERSKDLKTFEKLGEINDVASNANVASNYHFTDYNPFSGTSYYRLKQTDLDGKRTVYRAVAVILRSEAYGVFPNPVVRDGQFTLRLDEPETAVITFSSLNGRSILLQKAGRQSGNLLLKSTEKLAAGVYLLTVQERGQTRTHRLVVE